MPHLTKKSKIRIVVCGRNVEVYKYKRPYIFNRAPSKRRFYHTFDIKKTAPRRVDNIYRTRQRIRRLVNANATFYHKKALFVTYTFAENVTDIAVASSLWTKYTEKLNDFLKSKGIEKAKYLTVVEFQKRGAVHYHTIYFNLPYIVDIKEIFARLWGHGFVKINAIDNVRYIGNYISKYLQKGVVDERLRGRKAYFTSRGLQKPYYIKDEFSALDFFVENPNMEYADSEKFPSARYGIIDYSLYKLPKQ